MKINTLCILLFLMFSSKTSFSQISDFEKDSEDWKVTGDVQTGTQTPNWVKAAGNPGGYAQATDDATGGVWYWVAPKKFHGNKCSAYSNNLSFDLIQSETTDQFDAIDISIGGSGLTLVLDLPKNPNTFWTKYSAKLDENSGWKISTLTGASATKADIIQVLNDLNKIWIRGEYRKGKDSGGLDNVVLEAFQNIDLDGDDSSYATKGNYNGNTICGSGGSVNICDIDFLLNSLAKIKDIEIKVNNDAIGCGFFNVTQPNSKIFVSSTKPSELKLKNLGNADTTDFKKLILSTLYTIPDSCDKNNVTIQFVVHFADCDGGINVANFPIYKKSKLGTAQDTTICESSNPISMLKLLKNNSFFNGQWKYENTNLPNDLFLPKQNPSGLYKYVVKAGGNCPSDSISFRIDVQKNPSAILPKDTFICIEKPFVLSINDPFASKITWSNGATGPQTSISESGQYAVTATYNGCTFMDTINLKSFSCIECKIYVPNTFSPNSDGINDFFQPFSSCEYSNYSLYIFDRWGNLVFETNDNTQGWDGIYKGKTMNNETFVYAIRLDYEYLGKPVTKKLSGDLLLIR